MNSASIYLDHSATTPLHPEVLEVMLPYLTEAYGNPGSLHRQGRKARRGIETAREQVAALIGADPTEIVFTGSGTEANNMVVTGLESPSSSRAFSMTCSTMEHHSLLLPFQHAGRRSPTAAPFLPCDRRGVTEVNPESISPSTTLISVMTANNETGMIQPIASLGALCRERGILFHTDAIQAIGKIPVEVGQLPVDAMSLSAHKIQGPKGVGAFYLRNGLRLQPLVRGGPQEGNQRAGTENVAGIVGFGHACQLAQIQLSEGWLEVERLRDHLERSIAERIPDTWLNADSSAERLPHISNVGFAGLEGEAIMRGLDAEGISVSTGSACSSGSLDPSHVLLAMGQSRAQAHAAVRFSLGCQTTRAEMDHVLEVLPGLIERLRSGADDHPRPSPPR